MPINSYSLLFLPFKVDVDIESKVIQQSLVGIICNDDLGAACKDTHNRGQTGTCAEFKNMARLGDLRCFKKVCA